MSTPNQPSSGTEQLSGVLDDSGVPGQQDPYFELASTRARTVRLVISIPVLTMLIVLSAGAVLYIHLMSVSEHGSFTNETRLILERSAMTVLLLSALISLFSGVVGYILALQIVRPIRQLTERMEAIAAGDFSHRLETIRLGEFGPLGNTFNRMVDQLNDLFHERDRQIRESFSGAHLIIESSGIILHADSASQRIFGLSSNELIGRNLLEVDAQIPAIERNPRFLDILADLVSAAAAGKTSARSIPIRAVPPHPMQRFHASCTSLESGTSANRRMLLEVRDITGMPSFYEQMQRADRLAAVGTLATGIAHEIRNPLASIRGMIQLLHEERPDESAEGENSSRDYLKRVISEVDRLDKLISGVMTFANTDDSPAEPVQLNQMLIEVEESARLHVGEAAIKAGVQWELDEAMPEAILQAGKLRQAFLNLVVNAYQHCAEMGNGPIRIETVFLSVNPQRPVIVCVSNPGQAIEEQTRERLIEPFYTTKPDGTGLGLPIAYQIIHSNGGILELECEDGEIQFWVRLPKDMSARVSSRLIPRLETPLPRHRRATGSDNSERDDAV